MLQADPGMDVKVSVLKEMMAPEWGPALDMYHMANATPPIVAESSGVPDLLGSINPAAALGLLTQSLSPEAQKAVAAATALAQGNPVGAVMAMLPPEAQAVAGIAGPLLAGDLAGSLNALAGKFLPPELQGVFSAFMKMGGLSGVFGIKVPKLPSPFDKPKPPAPSSADLSTDPGADCGVQPKAARISDTRACPKGTGPIFTGQMNVLIGFMPAARIGDKGVCVGPPDVIKDGESSVLIGNSPASRLADKTAHGGIITTGFASVLIGKSHAPCAIAAAARRAAFVVNAAVE